MVLDTTPKLNQTDELPETTPLPSKIQKLDELGL